MSHNSVTDSTFRELETQIFIAEFTAVDARISTCDYWLDWARFVGDTASLVKLEKLQSALRLHRDCCRNILVNVFAAVFVLWLLGLMVSFMAKILFFLHRCRHLNQAMIKPVLRPNQLRHPCLRKGRFIHAAVGLRFHHSLYPSTRFLP